MNVQISDYEVRRAAVRALEARGYKITDQSSGSGVPKLSRIVMEKQGESLSCSIKKAAPNGRISFKREDDGSFSVLRDVDRVVHAWLDTSDPAHVRVTMFNKKTVAEAFEANLEAATERGTDHLPTWLNPDFERGQRFIGSGFRDQALWEAVVPITSDTAEPLLAASSASAELGIMDRIKAMLADHMGVRPELIEVDVRVKL